jgi:dsDNA-specific endonuclease/ATPase MutS2
MLVVLTELENGSLINLRIQISLAVEGHLGTQGLHLLLKEVLIFAAAILQLEMTLQIKVEMDVLLLTCVNLDGKYVMMRMSCLLTHMEDSVREQVLPRFRVAKFI